MKTTLVQSLAICAVVALLACGCGDDDSGFNTYNLTIENGSDTTYELHVAADVGNIGFVPNGLLASGESRVLQGLVADVTYTIRLVEPGSAIDDFDFEQTVVSDGGERTLNFP